MSHKVVILGGGFAGLRVARALRSSDADVTLIDRRNFHLFQPLLYQVATGSLSPSEISSPLRSVLRSQKNVRVLLGEASHIDAESRIVALSGGARFQYDTLVVAAGCVTSYFGHDNWRPYAQSLKSIEDSTEMRRRIFTAFERAELEGATGQHSPWMTFVIVGGGATGVELAGALSEIARKTLKDNFRSIHPEMAQLILVDRGPRLLSGFSERLAMKAEKALLHLGVRVRCGLAVTNIDGDRVELQRADGSTFEIPCKTVLWAGGVAVPQICLELQRATAAPVDRMGRIQVCPDLTVPGHPDIFVPGDLAALSQDGLQLPGVAQVALQEGAYVGEVIRRRLARQGPPAPFHYSDRGDMAVIGRATAVANVFGVEAWGWPAWLAWALIHLFYLVEFQSRIIVFVRWAFQYLTFSRGARIITAQTVPPPPDKPATAA